MHLARQTRQILIDPTFRAGFGEIAEVLGGAEAAGHDQRIQLRGLRQRQRLHRAAGNARRFNQDIARLRHLLT